MNEIIYPYLPKDRNIKYVDLNNVYMRKAKDFSEGQSTDRLQPTGSVLVKDSVIIGSAANVVPLKNAFLLKKHQGGLCVRKMLKVKTGTKYWLCPGCAKFKDHSEQRAIRDAVKNSHDPKGSDLYLYGHWWCCQPCWSKIMEAGIKEVYLLEGSEVLFNSSDKKNILGKNFK
ncbi:MAG: deaminase [Candidatus Paceibacterota bacterium]